MKKEKKNQNFEEGSQQNKPSQKPKKKLKKRRALKISLGVLSCGICAFLIYNVVKTKMYNSEPPVKDPFTSDNVIDNNGNELQKGEDGQIEFDILSEEDKEILHDQVNNLILGDAQIFNDQVDGIKDILSISLLPFNESGLEDEFDKYMLTILFEDNSNSTFNLNYLVGKDFESNEELSKDYFSDFINYISKECALFNCQGMSEMGNAILSKTNAVHVGEAYVGYGNSGDEYYNIPIYFEDGSIKLNSTWAPALDSYEQDPMEKFLEELMTPNLTEKTFEEKTYSPTTSLSKVMSIYNKIKTNTEEKTTKETDDFVENIEKNMKNVKISLKNVEISTKKNKNNDFFYEKMKNLIKN